MSVLTSLPSVELGVNAGTANPSVDEVLFSLRPSPFSLDDLREFLREEHCEENALFWARAEEFRQRFEEATGPTKVRGFLSSVGDAESAKAEIIATHVKPGAPEEVNIGSRQRRELLKHNEDNKKGCFDKAQLEIKHLIVSGPFERFLTRVAAHNITEAFARYRRHVGYTCFVLSAILTSIIILLEVYTLLGTPFLRLANLFTTVPAWAYTISGFQRVCSGLEIKCMRMREESKVSWFQLFQRKGATSDQVLDPFALNILRKRARIQRIGLFVGGVSTSVACLFIPLGSSKNVFGLLE